MKRWHVVIYLNFICFIDFHSRGTLAWFDITMGKFKNESYSRRK